MPKSLNHADLAFVLAAIDAGADFLSLLFRLHRNRDLLSSVLPIPHRVMSAAGHHDRKPAGVLRDVVGGHNCLDVTNSRATTALRRTGATARNPDQVSEAERHVLAPSPR